MTKELSADMVRRTFDKNKLKCKNSNEVSPLEDIVGQDRALKALKFGLQIKEKGFNIFVAGFPGTGKMTAVKSFLDKLAEDQTVPPDWCYVNNFQEPYEPKVIRLDPGDGRVFHKDMINFLNETKINLPKAFESEDFALKREATIQKIEAERNKIFSELNRKAEKEGLIVQSTPMGFVFVPIANGRPMTEEEFIALNPEMKEDIQKRRDKLNSELRLVFRQLKELDTKTFEEIKELNKEVALFTIGHLLEDLNKKYSKYPNIISYLKEVQEDILENIPLFYKPNVPQAPVQAPWAEELPFRKYMVNLFTDNYALTGRPVVVELNPTYQNLFGRIEKEAQFGMLTTDFTMIRGGSIHKANGGYLVIPAEELVKNLFSYDGLKRALSSEEAVVEEAGERLGFITTKGLRPSPIPLNVKVVIVGNPMIYQTLFSLDPEFKELFKVKAEFDINMDFNDDNVKNYVSFICSLCSKENLMHLDSSAIGKVIEYGARLADDQEKLSTKFADIADIIREANFYAKEDKNSVIKDNHIIKAVEEKNYRSNLIQERVNEMVTRGFYLIDTEGEEVGQINGLAVLSLGDFAFGRPSRVTATVNIGRGGIIDIEREAKMGGNIHSKGVMILGGYLAENFAQDKPLNLTARLVFEQNYEGVDGDSASSTELYAILSALSGIPIKQYLAVTGSVNQKGEVQAIGGVNYKIEGFYEICKAKGLNGKQGVLIPRSNVQNLMLKEEIVDAVRQGKFHIYSVGNIKEGIEILTGVRAGEKGLDGKYPEDTIYGKVDKRLREMSEKMEKSSEEKKSNND
ncbi:MAG: Archaeal Lon protease [Candidatus Methanofastidiosum methylothiophilum]|uniref:Archaeal Lon protease n=1 Tax=Candidatus Methanofastidiosum methylothiophilum TaxID=1705564 RepID=A0A150ILD3_9EURY|nr:MAG: Archaeal Lon protease [Candidatus Methanofastidiosum methylthiophilus]KYC48078.1 MAG: Archaeal Lon protease [Candidatus Methanofastidiosum methylthiophilus]KYC50469.1 MAG: Archaeal Lon protease [Candidatus Methanofastidiosum methylthiophilus]